MKRIGLLGGTFNPVHCGHLALAEWLVNKGYFNEVWLMLSPRNPLKPDSHPGATDEDRKQMLMLACENHPSLKPCFVEFDMPRPSYSISTLQRLSKDFADCRFSLIIGTDNWQIFNQWRQPEDILRDYGVVVYPRPGYPMPHEDTPGMTYAANAPVTDISSTRIRTSPLKYTHLLPNKVADYIIEHNLYEVRE